MEFKMKIHTDPKVIARMADGFRRAALVSALHTIYEAIDDHKASIKSLRSDAKEIMDELDGMDDKTE